MTGPSFLGVPVALPNGGNRLRSPPFPLPLLPPFFSIHDAAFFQHLFFLFPSFYVHIFITHYKAHYAEPIPPFAALAAAGYYIDK